MQGEGGVVVGDQRDAAAGETDAVPADARPEAQMVSQLIGAGELGVVVQRGMILVVAEIAGFKPDNYGLGRNRETGGE